MPSGSLDTMNYNQASILDGKQLKPTGPHLNEIEITTMLDLLTQKPEFQALKDHVGGLSQWNEFLTALANKDLGRVQKLLAVEFEAIGTKQYS